MKVDKLLQHIFSRGNLFSPAFSHWVESSEQFKAFAEKYKNKIRKKVGNAQKDPQPDEKLEDIIFELEMAYLLLKSNRFSVEYEHYGKKGPDFTVTDKTEVVFNVEVKRIRAEDSPQVRFDLWKSYVRNQIRNIPSTLALYMKFGDDLDTSLDLVRRLEDRTSEVIDYIVDIISTADREILVEGKQWFSVPGFGNEFVLRFRKPPYPTDTLANDGGESPLFRTGEEYLQFDKWYWKVLKNQVIPDMINVLAVNTDSKTHDSWALRICMHHLNELARRNDIEKTKQLSGLLFRGGWSVPNGEPNVLWCDEEAYCPIPEHIRVALRGID
jgi:hypothetical protein